MTITFKNDNDVIVYALECVIAYARRTQQIFVAHCVWWLASILGLEQELVSHIDRIQGPGNTALPKQRSREVSPTPRDLVNEQHDNQVFNNTENHTTKEVRDPVIQIPPGNHCSVVLESREDRQDQILNECEEYLRDSKRLREIAALKATGRTLTGLVNPTTISKKRLRKKDQYKRKSAGLSQAIISREAVVVNQKSYDRIERICPTEIQRRKSAGKCLRCAWPEDNKGSHRVKDCRRAIKLDKGTALPRDNQHQKSVGSSGVKDLEDSTGSEVNVTTDSYSSSE